VVSLSFRSFKCPLSVSSVFIVGLSFSLLGTYNSNRPGCQSNRGLSHADGCSGSLLALFVMFVELFAEMWINMTMMMTMMMISWSYVGTDFIIHKVLWIDGSEIIHCLTAESTDVSCICPEKQQLLGPISATANARDFRFCTRVGHVKS